MPVGLLQTFQREGLLFDVVDSGPRQGQPVVLLHGFPQDSSAWTAVAMRLNAAGYRTLAPDQRGYSPRARPPRPRDYTDRHLVDDVWALLDAADLAAAHVVGHDWGAAVAWAAAADRPDRVNTLSALSVPHPAALLSAIRRGRALQSWYFGVLLVPGLAERLLKPGSRTWQRLMAGLPDEHVARYTERMSATGAFTAALNWYRAIPAGVRSPGVRLGRIRVPTLFTWGSADPTLSPTAAAETADYVEAPYTSHVLDGSGHWLPETRSTEVSHLLLHHLSGDSHHHPGRASRRADG